MFDGCVGPTGNGMVWSIWHTAAGSSHPGQRQVRSRQRTNSANSADGRYPGSATGAGNGTGLSLAVAASSRSSGAGTAPNPGIYPGACDCPLTAAWSASTWGTTCPSGLASTLTTGQSSNPHSHGRLVCCAANAIRASARRWAVVRGSLRHTVAAISSRRVSSAAPSVSVTLPQMPAIPGLLGPISIYRLSRGGRGSRKPAGSNRSTHISMRSVSLGPDIRIHLGPHFANAESSFDINAGSVTFSVRFTIAATMRTSTAPVAKTSATFGNRCRRSIARWSWLAARPRLTFMAAEISATTLACPSMAQLMCSTSSSGARRTYNSPIAASCRAHAAFSSRADDPSASITSASSKVRTYFRY